RQSSPSVLLLLRPPCRSLKQEGRHRVQSHSVLQHQWWTGAGPGRGACEVPVGVRMGTRTLRSFLGLEQRPQWHAETELRAKLPPMIGRFALALAFAASMAKASPLDPGQVEVLDGDTIRVAGETFRLVGFDAPETYRARCPSERELGNRATFRL